MIPKTGVKYGERFLSSTSPAFRRNINLNTSRNLDEELDEKTTESAENMEKCREYGKQVITLRGRTLLAGL